MLDQVLTKYNALGEQEKSGRKLWQKIKFGNGEMSDMVEIRGKLTYYTSAMSLFLNMVSIGSVGRVERRMNDAGGDLKDIKVTVNGICAHLMSRSSRNEASILTAYADDDRVVWKEFRRELWNKGFSSSFIRKHKSLIKAYIEELGSRGLFDEENKGGLNDDDEENVDDNAKENSRDIDSVVEESLAHDPETRNASEAGSESPVESTPQPDLNIEPKTASHLKTESLGRETPIDNPVPEPISLPTPRWIWLGSGSGEKPQQSPAKETRKPAKLDNDDNSLFHDMWHEYHDDIAPRCLMWGIWEIDGEIDGSKCQTLIDRISRARSKVEKLRTLSVRKQQWTIYTDEMKQVLMNDMDEMSEILLNMVEHGPLYLLWKDERTQARGQGFRVKTHVETIGITVGSCMWRIGFRTEESCALCPAYPAWYF